MNTTLPAGFEIADGSVYPSTGEVTDAEVAILQSALAKHQLLAVLERPAAGAFRIDFTFLTKAGSAILFNADGSLHEYFSTLGLFQELADETGMLFNFQIYQDGVEQEATRVPTNSAEADFEFFALLASANNGAELDPRIEQQLMPEVRRAIFADASALEATHVASLEKTEVTYAQSELMAGFFFKSRQLVSEYSGSSKGARIIEAAFNELNNMYLLAVKTSGSPEVEHVFHLTDSSFAIPTVDPQQLSGESQKALWALLKMHPLHEDDLALFLHHENPEAEWEQLRSTLESNLPVAQKARYVLQALEVPAELISAFMEGTLPPEAKVFSPNALGKQGAKLLMLEGMAAVDRPGKSTGAYSRFDAYLRKNPVMDWLWTILLLLLGSGVLYAAITMTSGWVRILLIALGAYILIEAIGSLIARIMMDRANRKNKQQLE